ncbi:MAG: hypothetical protein PVJ40_01620 [Gammaproteobacteria bacterium]|jgi:hypothetical protein
MAPGDLDPDLMIEFWRLSFARYFMPKSDAKQPTGRGDAPAHSADCCLPECCA